MRFVDFDKVSKIMYNTTLRFVYKIGKEVRCSRMKNACIKLILPVFILSVFLSAGISVLAAGTEEDPLISLSYMQNIVKKVLSDEIDEKANEVIEPGSRADRIEAFGIISLESLSLEILANLVSDELKAAAKLPSEIPGINNQREVSLTREWEVTAEPGSTIFVKDGSISAALSANATVIDILNSEEISTNATLTEGDYVIVSEKGSVVFKPNGTATLLVTGVITYAKPLVGTVSIGGTAVFGQKLVANVPELENAYAEYRYDWVRNGALVGTGTEYNVTAQDIGKELVLTVVGEGVFSGSILSAPVIPVKAAQTAPGAPVMSSKTFNSVTLTGVPGCEYKCGDGAWQSSPVFGGLSGDTEYVFYARRAETETHLASPPSAGLTVKTYSASISSSKYSLNLSAGLISKINTKVTMSEFLSNITYSEFVSIYKGNDKVEGDAWIGTGMTVKLVIDDTLLQTLTIVVTGDINGDGDIKLTDFINLRAHILAKSVLTGGALKAADTNGDGNVNLTDFIKIRAHVLGKETIAGLEY
jgi:hypothetical protein